MTPKLVADTHCTVGEGPRWHPELGLLLFLDIEAGTVYAYSPKTGECRVFSQGPVTGAITVQEDGTMLLFQDGRISVLERDGKQRVVRTGLCPHNERFNDVLADPEGRVFAGAMGGGEDRLYRIDTDGSVTEVARGLEIPNGMAFSPDLRSLYFTESGPRRIYRFDYDRATGALSNRRVFAEIPAEEGLPDGMTADADGYLWTALWFGGRVKRYAQDGTLESEIMFPARQTSAPVFGGDDLATLYVTTAGGSGADSFAPPGHDPRALRGGGLYAVQVEGVRGTPLFRSRIRF
jgi:D-xylonolactonase